MSLSPPVSAGPTGLLEPPLSPGAPVMAREPSRSIEAEMVRMGLMSPDEVAATMREESETGRPFTELAVERGHVSAEHMAKIAKPVLPPVQRAPSETQPAAPEQRIPIFADSVLPPRPAARAGGGRRGNPGTGLRGRARCARGRARSACACTDAPARAGAGRRASASGRGRTAGRCRTAGHFARPDRARHRARLRSPVE